MNTSEMIQKAVACGAEKAVLIPQSQIALSETFQDICARNDCGNYGKYYTCPPTDGGILTRMREIRSFDHALWYQTIGHLEDSFDYEGMVEAGRHHARVCQRVHSAVAQQLRGRFCHLACGTCVLCERCARPDGFPCRHPDRALPAMEGWGVDVYNTTKGTPLAYINGQNSVTYFGLLLFTEADYV